MPHSTISFDPKRWAEIIQKPDWYLALAPELASLRKKWEADPDSQEAKETKKAVRNFFEKALLNNKVALASSGPNLDIERQPIDTIVIHHTSSKPGYRLSYMEATQLLNIYAPYYANPTTHEEKQLKGQAIWSNHFYKGKQTFLCYHWLMRMDGSFERLLDDDKLAWHAGNWDINKRSIAICLDNNYENQDPTDEILQKLAAHIGKYYSFVSSNNIIGHCEARQGTICPGGNFLGGWKTQLIKYVEQGK